MTISSARFSCLDYAWNRPCLTCGHLLKTVVRHDVSARKGPASRLQGRHRAPNGYDAGVSAVSGSNRRGRVLARVRHLARAQRPPGSVGQRGPCRALTMHLGSFYGGRRAPLVRRHGTHRREICLTTTPAKRYFSQSLLLSPRHNAPRTAYEPRNM